MNGIIARILSLELIKDENGHLHTIIKLEIPHPLCGCHPERYISSWREFQKHEKYSSDEIKEFTLYERCQEQDAKMEEEIKNLRLGDCVRMKFFAHTAER